MRPREACYTGPREEQKLYTDLAATLSLDADAEILAQAKTSSILSVRTQYTGMFCIALKGQNKDKSAMRSALQKCIKSLRADLAPILDPEEAKLPPTRFLAEAVKKKIADGFKFK